MQENKKSNSEPTPENVEANQSGYNAGNRDFQRTDNDIDNVSESEKEELEKRKQRTHQASSTPDKDNIG